MKLTQNKEGVDLALLACRAHGQTGVRPGVLGAQPQEGQRAAFRGHAAGRTKAFLYFYFNTKDDFMHSPD